MFSFALCKPFNNGGEVDATLFSGYATFINGILGTLLGLLNAFLIYRTFLEQREQFVAGRNSQEAFFRKERFENRLFEMIRLNREMVSNLEYEVPDEYTLAARDKAKKANKHKIVAVRGQRVFVQIHKHIRYALKECRWIREESSDFNGLFIDQQTAAQERGKLDTYYGNRGNNDLYLKIEWINIVYICVLFGMSEDGIEIVRKVLKEKYNPAVIEKVIQTLQSKPVKWSEFWEAYCSIKENGFQATRNGISVSYAHKRYTKFYGGHHHRLGQYFRHLFAIYNYINESVFDYTEKYSYAQSLRSQFSAYEQSVFFYNTLSSMGRIWEIEAKGDHEKKLVDQQMMTKYNIVKNIYSEFVGNKEDIGDLDLKEVYPLVEFEIGKPIPAKEVLKKAYQ